MSLDIEEKGVTSISPECRRKPALVVPNSSLLFSGERRCLNTRRASRGLAGGSDCGLAIFGTMQQTQQTHTNDGERAPRKIMSFLAWNHLEDHAVGGHAALSISALGWSV